MFKTEDYWAIWLGAALLIFATILVFANPPAKLPKVAEYSAIMKQEAERGGAF